MLVTEASKYFDTKRLSDLLAAFESKFERKPEAVIRVPGRVNLIGEHIDYCGYGVHPMAIQQDTLVAVAPANNQVLSIANMNNHLYASQDVSLENGVTVERGNPPKWWNYFLCGVKGVLEDNPELKPKGFCALVDGKIPPSAGLSSSSSLVVSAAICKTFY